MSSTEIRPNIVNFDQLRLTGTRTVDVTVRGVVLRITEKLEDDSEVDKELGRGRMTALQGSHAAKALMSLPSEDTPEVVAQKKELTRVVNAIDSLEATVTFDPRRIACAKISRKFTEWNLAAGVTPIPLDFDGLYDSPVPTALLQEIYDEVQNEPIVGEASA